MKKLLLCSAILFLFAAFEKADAANYTWTGTNNSNWNVSANWGGAGVPGSGDNVTIPNTTNKPTVNVTSACTSVTLSGNTTLTLGASLTVSGAFNVNNGVTATVSVGSGFTLTVSGGSSVGSFSTTALTLSGSGTTSIAGTSSYSQFATLTVSSGTLTFPAGASITMSNSTSLVNNGTINFNGTSSSGCSFSPGYLGSITNGGTINGTYFTLNETNNGVPFSNTGTFSLTNSTFNQGYQCSFTNSGTVSFVNCPLGLALNSDNITSTAGSITATNCTFTMSGGPANIANSGTSIFTATSCTFNVSDAGSTAGISNSATFNATSCTFNITGQPDYINNSGSGNFHISASTITLSTNLTNISNSGTGTFTIDGGSTISMSGYQCYISNTGSGIFHAGTSGSACTITISGQGATSGNTSILNSGTFYVGSTSIVNATGTDPTNPNIVKNTGTFTFQSDANGSASLGPLGAGSSVSGNYNVERYVTGGALARRGYRLLSTPVNQGTMGSTKGYSFTDLQARTPVTSYRSAGTYTVAQPSNAFDPSATNNPSVFFYYEPDADPNNQQIIKSDYKGLNAITDNFPIGNGMLFFFRGDRTASNFTTTSIPQNTTLNFYGAINQFGVTVYIPTAPLTTTPYSTAKVYANAQAVASLSSTFSYTSNSSNADGFHLIGNPYPCAIDLDAVTLNNAYSPAGYVYMLNNAGTFGVYAKGSGSTTLNNGVGRYVLSGQGFFVRGSSAGASLSFSEACKVTSVSAGSTPTTFQVKNSDILLASTKETLSTIKLAATTLASIKPQVLHITLALDSLNANETVIQFGQSASKNIFDGHEDAYYMSSMSQTTFMASYTSDAQPCIINQMGSLDSIKTIKLYAEGQTTGQYTMQFSGQASIDPRYKLFLVDNLLKDSVDLSTNSTYTFNIDRSNAATFGENRFTLITGPTNAGDAYNLVSFAGVKSTNGVLVSWKTTDEGDYTGFTLQRSIDGGKTFSDLTVLQSDGSGNYNFTDMSPVNGTNQYRLMQNNIDNVNILSDVVNVSYLTLDSQTNKLKIFPNPVSTTIQVALDQAAGTTFVINIYNIIGSPLMSSKFTSGSSLSMDVTKLNKGAYVIEVTDSNNKHYGSTTFTKL